MSKRLAVILLSAGYVAIQSTVLYAQDERLQRQQEILDLIDLPKSAAKARKVGYKDTDVKEIINLKKENKLSSTETMEILNEATISSREGEKVENLGTSVKKSIDDGKTGRDLANDIKGRNEVRKAERAEKERIRKEENERRQKEIQKANKKKSKKSAVKKSSSKKGKAAVKKKSAKKSSASKSKKTTKKSAKKSTKKSKKK